MSTATYEQDSEIVCCLKRVLVRSTKQGLPAFERASNQYLAFVVGATYSQGDGQVLSSLQTALMSLAVVF